jgi:hypothetical protein
MSQTLKPFRVSYYFEADIRTDGRVGLSSFFTRAVDADEAKANLRDYELRSDMVILNAYPEYHIDRQNSVLTDLGIRRTYTVKPTARQQNHQTVAGTTSSSNVTVKVTDAYPPTLLVLMDTPRTFRHLNEFCTDVTPFTGEIVRPTGPCQWHPNAILEADGRCPALDFNLPASRYPVSPDYTVLQKMVEEMPPLPKCPWHPETTLDAQGKCHASETIEKSVLGDFSMNATPVSTIFSSEQENPCVSQEVKDKVYANCEADFPNMTHFDWVSLSPTSSSLSRSRPKVQPAQEFVNDLSVKELDQAAKEEQADATRTFWTNPATYFVTIPVGALLLYLLVRIIFKH